jgi:hypothetical protein
MPGTAPSRLTRAEAQARIDQIHAFQDELTLPESDGPFRLSEEQRRLLGEYHGTLTSELAAAFDIDSNLRTKQLASRRRDFSSRHVITT